MTAAAADESVELDINGRQVEVGGAAGETLLQILRDRLGLTGAKPACESGECGACTVLVDSQPIFACLTLVARVEGRIETIEGLADETRALREAFAVAGAFQCGYCTPGHIVRAVALLRGRSVPSTDDELRHQLAGNICRCTGYAAIIQAIRNVATSEGDDG